MNNKSGKKIIKNPTPELGLVPNLSKRSFTKAALLTPVILSLANRPAWGATNRCMVSGFSSVMEIGSGVAGDSATCGYASATDILEKLDKSETKLSINTLFNCNPDPVYNPKIRWALSGSEGPWFEYMVIAYYNSLPDFGSNNPFPCPVEEVFRFFETNSGAFNFGRVSLDEAQTLEFLMAVLP